MKDWISTKDKLPNNLDKCLVCTDDNKMFVCIFLSIGNYFISCCDICHGSLPDGKITHWMPLPKKPPKRKKNA